MVVTFRGRRKGNLVFWWSIVDFSWQVQGIGAVALRNAEFVAGGDFEARNADFVAGAALCEPQSADFVAGTAIELVNLEAAANFVLSDAHSLTSPHLTKPHLTSPHLTSPHSTALHCTSLHSRAKP